MRNSKSMGSASHDSYSGVFNDIPSMNNFMAHEKIPRSQNDIRVKFEYKGEKRIIPVSRPVLLNDLKRRICNAYGHDLTMSYINNDITIPIKKQMDLDNAVALLDFSPQLTSLRIYLSNEAGGSLILVNSSKSFRKNLLNNNGFWGERISWRKGNSKPRSNSDSLPPSHDPQDTPVLLSSTFHHERHYSFSSVSSNGHYSPPGFVPDPDFRETQNSFVRNSDFRDSSFFMKSEGEFVPESNSVQDRSMFDPLNQVNQGNVLSSPSLGDSLAESNTSLQSFESYSDLCQPLKRSRQGYEHILSTFSQEMDFLSDSIGSSDSKAGTFPRRHHTIALCKADLADGNQTFPRIRKPLPFWNSEMASGITSASSSSSGLVPDIEDRRSSNLFAAVPKNWKLGRLLGTGAFGQVFLCHDTDNGRELAVKQIDTGITTTAQQKEINTLEVEIDLLKTINHNAIVSYYGTQQTGTRIWIFMEYMPGGSIYDHLKQHGPLSESLTSKYTRQILHGVSYLHSYTIIHRDIKGANILRDTKGNVKLADFGASKRLQTTSSMTGFKSVHGTPYWMAPEVINGAGYGRKADIWSVGCTVVEMLTGKPPWSEFEPMAALFKIATQETEPDLPHETSVEAREFVETTLMKDSNSRPRANELLSHIFVQEQPNT
ncbi:mitogen-activated protein kinase kinase kinase 2-like [Xenia sp. Carnegie-2017]|uniref:mitogen-activated protein kinase kinase kinase 2-like n=1 Tax=Xenia sp. Carnegie-2017 TaxID=2897299 RepID=UPI001F043544|nr:mitogen-activated protein kinase kinase kinase 2-like [Xenia sp. Carnegie-2017]